MLHFTRKIGEEIVIGDNVLIKVLALHGGQVRIGIAAPDAVAVHRREIYNQIREKGGMVTSFAGKSQERALH